MSDESATQIYVRKRNELVQHVNVWKLFYVKISIKVAIAVLPVFLVEFANYHKFEDIEQMTWAVLILNALLQAVNVINSMMDSTFKNITDAQAPAKVTTDTGSTSTAGFPPV